MGIVYDMPLGKYVAPPTEHTLRAYLALYWGGDVSALFTLFGVDPFLAERVDQGLQVLPLELAERIAEYIGRPAAELVWAAGGKALTAGAPGDRRSAY